MFLIGIPYSQVAAQPANAPTLTNVSPTQAYNYQATTITITGANFVATPTVNLGNFSLSNVTFVNSTTLTATVPADLPGGTYTITVTNPDSQSASLANAFTVMMSGDGTLGNWQATLSLNTPRFWHTVVVIGNYIFAIGGRDNNNATIASVERAAINADGSLGAWQYVSSMTTPRCMQITIVANGYLYAAGGYSPCSGDNYNSFINTVERAPINADGTLGAWQLTTPLLTASATRGICRQWLSVCH
jgi:hypothetical protein